MDADNKRFRLRLAPARWLGALATIVASGAAAISAWLSWQGLTDFQAAQLLESRVQACSDVSRFADETIAAAIKGASYTSEIEAQIDEINRLADGINELERTRPDLFQRSGDGCPERGPERAACLTMRQDMEERGKLNERLGQVTAQSMRRFDLLGPEGVADAEENLIQKLNWIGPEGSQLTHIEAALAARHEFREACRAAVAQYSGADR